MVSAAEQATIPESRRRFHFSLRDLMELVFGFSVGLAAARHSWVKWYEAPLVAAISWIILGLGGQLIDLRAALRLTPGLSPELRWGGRWAIAWRAAAVVLLAGYCMIEALQRQGILVLERHQDAFYDVGGPLRALLFYLVIIAALSSVPRLAPRRPAKTIFSRLLQTATWLVAIALGLLVWSGTWTSISYVVHIAISGVEATFPLRFANPEVDLDLVARTKRFAIHTTLAAAFVPLNLWLTIQLARGWSLGARRRAAIAVGLLISFGATTAYLVWFHLIGRPQFSPWLAGNASTAPSHIWLTAALVLLVAAGMASYRLVSPDPKSDDAPRLPWRRGPRRYDHERRFTMLVLGAGLGGGIAATLYSTWDFGWVSALNGFLSWPANYGVLAAFWLALLGLFGGWRNSSESIASGQVAVSPRKLVAVWLAAFLTLATSAALIAWFCFSLWLWLGYRFDWP